MTPFTDDEAKRENPFTDEHLKRLKARIIDPKKLEALLFRLEAAEAVCDEGAKLTHTDHCTDANNCCAEDCFCGYDDFWRSLQIWRKEAGK